MAQKCSGKSSRTGEPCKAWAIKGGTVCITHGGKAKQVRAKAQQRTEREREQAAAEKAIQSHVVAYRDKLDGSPAEILLDLVQHKAAEVAYWRDRVQQLDADQLAGMLTTKTDKGRGPQGPVDTTTTTASRHVVLELLHDCERDLGKLCRDAIAAGATEVMVNLAQRQGAFIIEWSRRLGELARREPAASLDVLIERLMAGGVAA